MSGGSVCYEDPDTRTNTGPLYGELKKAGSRVRRRMTLAPGKLTGFPRQRRTPCQTSGMRLI